jgi:hypothetical protein
MIRVLEERSDELIASLETVDGLLKRPSESERGYMYFFFLKAKCCSNQLLGESSHQEEFKHRAAVAYMVRTRSLWYAPKRQMTGHVSPNDTTVVPNEQSVVHSIANLGLAQKRAGSLSKAKERITMRASFELH